MSYDGRVIEVTSRTVKEVTYSPIDRTVTLRLQPWCAVSEEDNDDGSKRITIQRKGTGP